MHLRLLVLATVFATAAFCQFNITVAAGPLGATQPIDAYQINYFTHFGDVPGSNAYIDVTNAGTNGVQFSYGNSGTTASASGSICVNVYVFAPDEQMEACCACAVTPDGLLELDLNDLLSNTLINKNTPTASVVKLVASGTFNGGAAGCNAATPFSAPGSGATGVQFLAPGMIAWGTKLHAQNVTGGVTTYALTETQFVAPNSGGTYPWVAGNGQNFGGISAEEAQKLATLCAFTQAAGSGSGACPTTGSGTNCQMTALGATKK